MAELQAGLTWGGFTDQESVRGLCFFPPTSDLPEGHTIVRVLKKRQMWDSWPSARLFLSLVSSVWWHPCSHWATRLVSGPLV